MCVVEINLTDIGIVVLQYGMVLHCSSPYKSYQFAVVHEKLINCNSAYKIFNYHGGFKSE